MEWKNTFANHVSDKGSILKIHSELVNSTAIVTMKKQFEMGKGLD